MSFGQKNKKMKVQTEYQSTNNYYVIYFVNARKLRKTLKMPIIKKESKVNDKKIKKVSKLLQTTATVRIFLFYFNLPIGIEIYNCIRHMVYWYSHLVIAITDDFYWVSRLLIFIFYTINVIRYFINYLLCKPFRSP